MKIEYPIRVLNLFTIMNRGGAETMVMNYYRNIDRSKVQFDFMVHRDERGAYDDEIEELGGRLYRMPPIRPWSAFEYCKKIDHFYKEHQEYSIIHSHMSELGYYDFIIAEKNGVPVRICHAHNTPRLIDIKTPIRWYYKKRMISHITDFFVCGRDSGEWLFGKNYADSFVLMRNAIEAKQFSYNLKRREKLRAQLGISKDQLVVGHVGRFARQKNHSFLIDVFNEVCKVRDDSILLLIGGDEINAEEIKNKVMKLGLQNNVFFLGQQSNVNEWLQAMDVFVFPSLFEGFGIAALEAQASGLPTIVSNNIPNECLLTDLIRVFSLSDSKEKWAEAILASSKNDRTDRVELLIEQGFDINENAKWLQDYYLAAFKGCVSAKQ